MNIIQRGLRRIMGGSISDSEVLANGLSDKRDVEDPTGKFFRTRFVAQINPTKLRKNVEFSRPEYDLPTIANAIQMDGFLQRSVNIFVEQILKNGYDWISKNDRAQRYINKRMKEIQNLTGVPFYELMNAIARQLVTYGNAYIIKVRSGTKSRWGREYQLYNRKYDPIVGLFVADATTIDVGINENGQIVNYRQKIAGSEIYWDEREVIHITYNRIPGTLTGMSSIIPVLDDVRALRKLEEEIEILGFQYSIPLYLYKVGTKETPPAPGEIDQVKETVNNMPAYGMLVVPGHHTIEVPTNNNTPVDLLSFINHFKLRICAGLGVSPVALGEGASNNRNTSEVMDISMQTITKRYQQLIKHRLEIDLFREILLDGSFDVSNELIEFNFPEIDMEAQIKKESNIIQKWQNNMITRQEARLELDRESSIDDADTFLRLVDIPKIEAQKSISIEVAKISAAAKMMVPVGGTTRGTSSSTRNSRTTDTKVRPANQYGKSTGRPKYVRDEMDILIEDSMNKIGIFLQDGNLSNLKTITLSNKLIENTQNSLKKYVNDCVNALCNFHHIKLPEQDNLLIDNYLNNVNIIINDKIKRLGKKLDSNIKIELFSKDLKDFLSFQKDKATNLAKLLVYKSLGFVTILVNADSCKLHSDVSLNLTEISYSDVPPLRYNCGCTISEKSMYEFNEVDSKIDSNQA